MSCGFRQILGRAVCLLTALGLLAATAPGCGGGGEPPKTNAQIQKEDNSAMLNFMKSQQKKKK